MQMTSGVSPLPRPERTRRAPGWRASEADIAALVDARHGDPFAVLGPHRTRAGVVLRALTPGAAALEAVLPGHPPATLERRHDAGFFEGLLPGDRPAPGYRL